MALVKANLAAAILQSINDIQVMAQDKDIPSDTVKEAIANKLADNFDAYIKTADVNVQIGAVQVQGSPSAQQNTTPLIFPTALS